MKNKFLTVLALSAVILLGGCNEKPEPSQPDTIVVEQSDSGSQPEKDYPLTLSDGTEIKAPAERVVSLSPAVTEIIAELGCTDKLAAVSRYCDYPEGLDKPQAGSSENPDIDEIIKLAPDVVFTLSSLAEREIYALTAAGITPVSLSAPVTVKDYCDLYQAVSAVMGADKKAAVIAEERLNAAAKVRLESFVYVTPKLTAAGKNTFEGSVLSLCGENLCTAGDYTESEEFLTEIPKYIIAADSLTTADLTSNTIFSGMINGGAEVLFVPEERFERPSARLTEVFEALSGQLKTE